ncbi:DUF4406 domain-containing protein [Adlercreutzia equolifaciens]|uniref:DUF4406 domain-containing protein n=1 Tax=Adlercreutzia equolifaciens TaxID=446660 RepID=UPI0026DB5F22|nr:DUF4406 domain-containing protein [Adlercreutzia equolifaciens]
MTNWEKYFEGIRHELLEEICQLTKSCDNCSLRIHCEGKSEPWHEWVDMEADQTRFYISGPVTGIKDDNRLAFSWAQNRLMDAGYEPFIPHEIVEPDDTHETAMLLCVNELTERTQKRGTRYPVPAFDGVALLPDWEQSEGARLEKAVAEACGIPCKTVEEWIKEAR